MRRLAAVALKDLRTASRGPALTSIRTGWAVLAAASLAILLPGHLLPSRATALVSTARIVGGFFALWVLAQGVLAVVAAGRGATGMERERRARTLPLLHLTHLRPLELALGSLAADLALLAALFLAPLPVLALLSWFGGVSFAVAGEATLLALALAAVGVSLGLLCGTAMRPGLGGLVTGLALVLVLAATLLWPPARLATETGHPVLALHEVAWQVPEIARRSSTSLALGSCAVLCLLLLAATTLLLARTDRTPGRHPSKRLRKHRRSRPPRGNPIRSLAAAGDWIPSTRFGALAWATGLTILLLVLLRSPLDLLEAWGWIAVLAVLLLALPGLWTTGLFTEDRVDLLVGQLGATPLTARRILLGYLQAAALRYAPVAMALLLPLMILLVGEAVPAAWLVWAVVHAAVHSLTALSLGILFSVWHRRRLKAVLLTLVTLPGIVWATASIGLGLFPFFLVLSEWQGRWFGALSSDPFQLETDRIGLGIPLTMAATTTVVMLPVARALFYVGVRNLDRSLGRSS